MKYRFFVQRLFIMAIWSMILSVMLLSPSCVKKQQFTLRDHAISLYNESRRLIKIYIDSMSHAGDSAKVEAIGARFEDKLAKLNFKYPANTDLDISEDENDTLIMLTTEYVVTRDSMLYRFAHPLLLRPDSLAADSTAKAVIPKKTPVAKPKPVHPVVVEKNIENKETAKDS